MATARRIAPEPPTHRLRRRARGVAASLAGGVAGLAVGAACVAWPPEGDLRAAPGALPPSKAAEPQARHPSRRPETRDVAAVLAPATDAGVIPSRGDEEGAP
jgi:hypothetical protein